MICRSSLVTTTAPELENCCSQFRWQSDALSDDFDKTKLNTDKIFLIIKPFHSGYFQTGTFFGVCAVYKDKIKTAKQIFRTEMHHNLEISTCVPFKYKIGNSLLILSTCMGNLS